MKIVEIREVTKAIGSAIRNAYIDFSKMTLSLVAVVTTGLPPPITQWAAIVVACLVGPLFVRIICCAYED